MCYYIIIILIADRKSMQYILLYPFEILNSILFGKIIYMEKKVMENIKRKLSLNIAGKQIAIITDENPDYVLKLTSIISQRVSTLALSGNGVSKADAALVYALELLDENFKLKKALEEAKNTESVEVIEEIVSAKTEDAAEEKADENDE